VHREVGERLAVDLDAGGLDAGDEPAVREPEAARRRVDALDPQRAVVALSSGAARRTRTGRP
jgi:hypothetical protein